jgi:hypothetical protein
VLDDDAAGAARRRLLEARRIDGIDLGLGGATPDKLRIAPPDRPLLRLGRSDGGAVTARALISRDPSKERTARSRRRAAESC